MSLNWKEASDWDFLSRAGGIGVHWTRIVMSFWLRGEERILRE
jgi:hypothetical protein